MSSNLPKSYMGAGLGGLSAELLYLIFEIFFSDDNQPVPQFYLGLARACKHFYGVFMSDRLWKDLDVHCVGRDIAAHYLKLKSKMLTKEMNVCKGFDYVFWRHPKVSLATFYSLSLYTQASILAQTNDPLEDIDYNCEFSSPELISHVSRTCNGLWYASSELKQNRKFLLQIARQGGCSVMFYASDVLKGNRELALIAAEYSTSALTECAPHLTDDREVVMKHIQYQVIDFQYASDRLKNDPEIALAAIQEEPFNLQHCSEALRDNNQIVLAAVESDGICLEFASTRLKNDRQVVLTAIKSNDQAFEHAGLRIRKKIIQQGINNI